MNKELEVLMDILFLAAQGWLFYRLMIQVLGIQSSNWEKWRAYIMLAAPFGIYRMLIMYAEPVRKLIYGPETLIRNSRDTIGGVLLGCLILLVSGLCYSPKRGTEVTYLTLMYTAVCEILRFGVFCLTYLFPNLLFALLNRLLEQQEIGEKQYMFWAGIIQDGWQWLFFTMYLVCVFLTLRECVKYLVRAGRKPKGSELFYLMIPVAVSFGLGILLRSMWVFVLDDQMHLIFDNTPFLYVMIPGIAFCSVLLVVSGIRMRCRLIEEEEERFHHQVYQSQLEDMERYLRDLEGMQEGLKGMRHDMKNYAADIHALIRLMQTKRQKHVKEESIEGLPVGTEESIGGLPVGTEESIQKELIGYLGSMEHALDQFQVHEYTGNTVTDVIIHRFRQQAKSEGIRLECRFCFPQSLEIHPFDISIILNNAWNNAMEACKKLPVKERMVSLKGVQREGIFFLEMRNSIKRGSVKWEGSFPVSEKLQKEEHGLGLKNIARCVKKYGGYLECREEAGSFLLTILLQSSYPQ